MPPGFAAAKGMVRVGTRRHLLGSRAPAGLCLGIQFLESIIINNAYDDGILSEIESEQYDIVLLRTGSSQKIMDAVDPIVFGHAHDAVQGSRCISAVEVASDEKAFVGLPGREAQTPASVQVFVSRATRSHGRWAGDRRRSQRRSTAHSPTTSPYVSVTICCVVTRLTNSGAAVTLSLSGSWVGSRLDVIVRHGRSDVSHT